MIDISKRDDGAIIVRAPTLAVVLLVAFFLPLMLVISIGAIVVDVGEAAYHFVRRGFGGKARPKAQTDRAEDRLWGPL